MSDSHETAIEETAMPKNVRKLCFASQKGRLGACMTKLNEIKALMNDAGNVDTVCDALEVFKRNSGHIYKCS